MTFRSNRLVHTVSFYLIFQGIKVATSIFLFLLLFQRLSVPEYAVYGIIQSLAMIASLLLTMNTEASAQKLYSKTKLRSTVNAVFALACLGLFATYTFIFVAAAELGLVKKLFSGENAVPKPFILFAYTCTFSYLNLAASILNAQRNTADYGLVTSLPPATSLLGCFLVETLSLDVVLVVISLSNLFAISVVFLRNTSFLAPCAYSKKRLKFVFYYLFGYTSLSIPTLGAKYSVDLIARTFILSNFGSTAVAALTFSSSLFSVVRSAEQAFFKAVTPIILANSEINAEEDRQILRMVIFQSVITLTIFSLAVFWLPYVADFFEEKPSEIFVPLIYFLMSLIAVTSFFKNHILAYIKRNLKYLRRYYGLTLAQHLFVILILCLLTLDVVEFLLLQIVAGLFHLIATLLVFRRLTYRNGNA